MLAVQYIDTILEKIFGKDFTKNFDKETRKNRQMKKY